MPGGDLTQLGLHGVILAIDGVAGGQQIAGLGIEAEEEAIEDDQRGLMDGGHVVLREARRALDHAGHKLFERVIDAIAEAVGDVEPVAAAAFEDLRDRAGAGIVGHKCAAAEKQPEVAEVLHFGLKQRGQVNFIVAEAGAGAFAFVDAPEAAIGEDAPSDA